MLRWVWAVLKKGFARRAAGHLSGIQEGLGEIIVDVSAALCFCSFALLAGIFEREPIEGLGSCVGERCLEESGFGENSGLAEDSWHSQDETHPARISTSCLPLDPPPPLGQLPARAHG